MEPFLGEIRLLPLNWAPEGFLPCDGRMLPVQQNQALYSLLSNRFGGDGKVNFALPDLRGRVPVAQDAATYQMAARGGQDTVALAAQQAPAHIHTTNVVNAAGDKNAPKANLLAQVGVVASTPTPPTVNIYNNADKPANVLALNDKTIEASGANVPHANMQPYTVVGFYIAILGTYPPRP